MSTNDPLADASDLVGYMYLHADTPRALVHQKHMIQFAYVAGRNLAGKVTWEDYNLREPGMGFVSLHSYDTKQMVAEARVRIEAGTVPSHWREDLEYKLKTGRWDAAL